MQGCPSSLIGNGPVTLSEGLLTLFNEHTPLRNRLETLLSLSNKVKEEEDKSASFVQLVQEVKEFKAKLDHHSSREEDYLFKMMEAYIGNQGGPLAVMEYEHEQAKGFIGEFSSNVEKNSLSPVDMDHNAELIRNAYYTLVDHFSKEEQVLFPMAERMLSQEEKEQLKQKVAINIITS